MPAGLSDIAASLRSPAWLALLFFALGMGLVVAPYSSGDAMPGGLGDPRFNAVMLEYFYRCLVAIGHGQAAHFFDAPFFYPWPLATHFSDCHWGDGLPYVLARAAGAGKYAAFQIWFCTGFVLTYVSAYWCLRRFGLSPFGAAAGAFLFSFPLPATAQYGHAQLLYRLFVPPAMLAFDRAVTRRDRTAGAACFLFTALQYAMTIYIGYFLVLLFGAYLIAMAWSRRLSRPLAPPPARRPVAAAAMLIAGLAVFALVALPYFRVQEIYGFAR
ncbi:MAG: hypothetical protein ACREFC_09795, partial [Stellaceae bacterium]